MLVSYNWLKYYIELPDSLTPEEVAHKLTMSTVEVEGVEKQGQNLNKVVVGKVESVQKHPNADKLNICTVAFGEKYPVQIVCGGSNVREGMLVALAGLGAKVQWHGEGELVELKKVKIRDIESYGMICASTEIGLGSMFPLKDEKEILDLSSFNLKVGTPLAEALKLNDSVFDIDNKSMTHRPDLWGHYGIAREVAALYNKKLKEYKVSEIKKQDTRNKQITNYKLQVDVVDTKLCPRYMAVAIDGIKIAPSPEWMQKLLLAVGLRPINNIVDITNFILFDLGQPMHAFDKRDLAGDKIVVRRAGEGEKFVTLDETEHELTKDDLVIADSDKAVALAGIMGGLNSEIKDDTTSIVFESANFDATTVRKTAVRLGVRTDSSARFEKSLDPNNAELALKRAVELTLEMCPEARMVSSVVDKADFHLVQGPIQLPLDFLKMKMGIEIDKKQVIKILESLGFEVSEKKDLLMVKIPTWRATKDISIKEDLVEEIARIYGYNNFVTTLPMFPIIPPERNELRLLERKIKNILSLEETFTETYNYSFVAPETLAKLGMQTDRHVALANPIAKDRPFLRRTLLTNLLENVEKNLHHVDSLKLFEIGKIFDTENPGARVEENSDELLPRQNSMLGLVYSAKGVEQPFYTLSSALENIMNKLGVQYSLTPEVEVRSHIHPGRQASIVVNNERLGFVAELHPTVQNALGIEHRVGILEIDLNQLLSYVTNVSGYKRMPIYPAVERDIAFVVGKEVTHKQIVESLENVDELVRNVELFDVFEGSKIGEDKKSMAYHIIYRSDEKTLESSEVDKIHDKLIKKLEKEFGAEVRV